MQVGEARRELRRLGGMARKGKIDASEVLKPGEQRVRLVDDRYGERKN
jgi:hypothetical protein